MLGGLFSSTMRTSSCPPLVWMTTCRDNGDPWSSMNGHSMKNESIKCWTETAFQSQSAVGKQDTTVDLMMNARANIASMEAVSVDHNGYNVHRCFVGCISRRQKKKARLARSNVTDDTATQHATVELPSGLWFSDAVE